MSLYIPRILNGIKPTQGELFLMFLNEGSSGDGECRARIGCFEGFACYDMGSGVMDSTVGIVATIDHMHKECEKDREETSQRGLVAINLENQQQLREVDVVLIPDLTLIDPHFLPGQGGIIAQLRTEIFSTRPGIGDQRRKNYLTPLDSCQICYGEKNVLRVMDNSWLMEYAPAIRRSLNAFRNGYRVSKEGHLIPPPKIIPPSKRK